MVAADCVAEPDNAPELHRASTPTIHLVTPETTLHIDQPDLECANYFTVPQVGHDQGSLVFVELGDLSWTSLGVKSHFKCRITERLKITLIFPYKLDDCVVFEIRSLCDCQCCCPYFAIWNGGLRQADQPAKGMLPVRELVPPSVPQ